MLCSGAFHHSLIKTLLLCAGIAGLVVTSYAQPRPVSIAVDLSKEIGDMEPIWAWFGYDEPNYTYMKDGRKLLSELASLGPGPVYIRTHNMLTSGDGKAAMKWGSTNVYTEDASGNPVYNWTIVDSIFNTYIKRGLKPLAEIGFMPEALSVKPQPYSHNWQPGRPYGEIFTGWRYPPKDYLKWEELVFQWVTHSIKRYGHTEVDSWYWELWNEPDIGYWGGTWKEFFKLYDYTAHAVKRASPTARIGGPHTTGPLGRGSGYRFLEAFLKHCTSDTNAVTGSIGTPLDFIAFHAKGAPRVINGHVRMNLGTQLKAVSNGFELVSSFPQLKHLPIIIGESDPEGCAACGMNTNPENGYRNSTMYSSYTAAAFARKYALADHFDVNLKSAVTWAFEFEDQPWFYGFRDLATNGVDKPVLNVFRMFGKMNGKRVQVNGNQAYSFLKVRDSSVRGEPDIDALACKGTNKFTIMVWHYHDDDTSSAAAPVEIRLSGVPSRQADLRQYRIDQDHSNSYSAWQKMGSPQQPSASQLKKLENAGQLQTISRSRKVAVRGGEMTIKVDMPRQAVSLFEVTW